jgi:hypothetical protein
METQNDNCIECNIVEICIMLMDTTNTSSLNLIQFLFKHSMITQNTSSQPELLFIIINDSKFEVTLQLTVSQYVLVSRPLWRPIRVRITESLKVSQSASMSWGRAHFVDV